MSEREDWDVDIDGNLSPPPSEGRSDTDEFGREDPAAIERERRRREREARRVGRSDKREKKSGGRSGAAPRKSRSGSGGGGMFRGLRRRKEPAEAPPAARPPRAPASAEAPAAPRGARRPPATAPPPAETAPPSAEAAPPPQAPQLPPDERAATTGSAADSLRQRLARGRGGRGGGGDPPSPPGRIRRRRIFAIVAGIIGILFVWFLVALFQPFAGDGFGEGRVVVNIPQGASASEVADLLAGKGVVDNSTLFQIRLKLSGKSNELVSGPLGLASGMSYGAAIDRLTGGGEAGKLVIPEGDARSQIAPLVADAGIDGDYLAATKSYKGFDPAKYGAKDPPNLEGFLFPATYDVTSGETVDDLVGEQLLALKQNLKGVDLSYAEKKGNLTPYDVLTIASMIDREVVVDKERPLVAAVIWNRLHQGIPLGIDATTRYEYDNFDKAITQAQLDKDTPYNTRINDGLPPTPIGNPGLASIKAAAHPASVNYTYYVVNPDSCNGHTFTASAAEFDKLVAKYDQARKANGGEAPSSC